MRASSGSHPPWRASHPQAAPSRSDPGPGAITVDNLPCAVRRLVHPQGDLREGHDQGREPRHAQGDLRAVIGNVQAEGHADVTVASSSVGGSIQLEQGGSASVTSNRVNGDVQSFTNRGKQTISKDRIDGNLQC